MKIALCNEVVRELSFERQCTFAAELGYDGLELAPFTLGENPHFLSVAERARLRRAAAGAGIRISGLHWLLLAPEGLSITSADPAVRARTLEVIRRLVELAADLGAEVLVHGSPGQRRLDGGSDREAARARGIEAFVSAGEAAAAAGVTYCIEPLAPPEADFVTTIAEAAQIVRETGNPALLTMLDASAASQAEVAEPAALLESWLPTGLIGHVHLNDRNRQGPGQGEDRFAPLLRVLHARGWSRWVGVEPFVYRPDGPASAARAIGYVRGILESIA
ncbi:sugar phosphate isomerase/epimerase family protein [Marinimicrococcus flavescens]|uniref:Sugar phosphate isomerase/epimerase n=1 Tax=Marinimicrococcus flavescens TaxID=3031815 RepID=A0AAP3V1I6_9PROT|nr:sugar phosphate isomerase/epimerase [Marinimicrococcus flavescens]